MSLENGGTTAQGAASQGAKLLRILQLSQKPGLDPLDGPVTWLNSRKKLLCKSPEGFARSPWGLG